MASTGLSQDQVFEVLKSPRRRYALYYLRREGGIVELSDLTDQVAVWENETTPSGLTSEQRKRVYISLYQTHLPKLDDAGIVEYDRDEGTISLSRRARELDTYLGDVSRPAIPWDRYYLALSIGSILLVLGVWFNVYPFALISGIATAIIILIAYGVSAIGQYLYYRRRTVQGLPPELRRAEGQ
jgi:DNA-binding transcriptional ArsR family regulator